MVTTPGARAAYTASGSNAVPGWRGGRGVVLDGAGAALVSTIVVVLPPTPTTDPAISATPAPIAAAATASPTAAMRPMRATVATAVTFPRGNGGGRSGRFHVETTSSPACTAAPGSESVNVVRPVVPLSSTVPPIRSASWRAIARPRPLPEACGPSTR